MNYYVYIQWVDGQPELTKILGSMQSAVAWAEARSKAWLGNPGAPRYLISYNPSGQRVAIVECGSAVRI